MERSICIGILDFILVFSFISLQQNPIAKQWVPLTVKLLLVRVFVLLLSDYLPCSYLNRLTVLENPYAFLIYKNIIEDLKLEDLKNKEI